MDAAARGTDVSLWVLQQCPSTAATFAELELALQLGSSNMLVYSAPLGLHVWRSFPSVRMWGHTLVTYANHLLSASRIKLNSPRRSTRRSRALGLEALPNGTSTGWYTSSDRLGTLGHVYLALVMTQVRLPSPTVLTLPAPAPVLGLPAPRPVLALPAPALVLSITAPGIVLSLPMPKPTHTLPTTKSVFTQPPVKAFLTFEILPTPTVPNLEGFALPSPGLAPFCAQPTLDAPMVPPSPPASEAPAVLSATVRGFCPVLTKPIVHNTTRKWHDHFSMACLVVLTLGFQLASCLFEGPVRHLVEACYPLDVEIPGERDGLGHALDPFGELAVDMSSLARSGMLSGLAPDLFRFCDQPEPVDTAFGHGEHDELDQALDPFDKLVIDTFGVVRSGRLGGLAPDLFRFCGPELPDAALEDTLDEPLGLTGTVGGMAGEDMREELLVPEDAPVEAEEAGGICEMDRPTASSDILVAVGGSVDVASGAMDTQLELEPEDGLDQEVEAQAGERQVGAADGSIGDSSRSLEDIFTRGNFAWSDEAEALELNDATTAADTTSRTADLQLGLGREPDQPGPTNLEPEREGSQSRGPGTSSSRWAPRGEGGWGGGYRGGQGGGNRGGWGGGAQNGGRNGGGWNGGRGGAYSGGRGAYGSGTRGAYGGGGGGGNGRDRYGSGNGGNGGAGYRGGGDSGAGRDGRNGNRRESKSKYFFRLRQERKDAAREAAEN
ncbi:hypothetical protein FRC06_004770 [Ceratobasidium sp. 370]|nr:hypothetical protein FRC06_004770 [Ceratobasidium sp. 370]